MFTGYWPQMRQLASTEWSSPGNTSHASATRPRTHRQHRKIVQILTFLLFFDTINGNGIEEQKIWSWYVDSTPSNGLLTPDLHVCYSFTDASSVVLFFFQTVTDVDLSENCHRRTGRIPTCDGHLSSSGWFHCSKLRSGGNTCRFGWAKAGILFRKFSTPHSSHATVHSEGRCQMSAQDAPLSFGRWTLERILACLFLSLCLSFLKGL